MIKRNLPYLFAALMAVPLLSSNAAPASAQSFSGEQRGEIERIVKEYLLSHPELLQDVMAELEKRQTLAEAEKHRAAVKEHSATIFSSPRQVTLGNARALAVAKEVGFDVARLEKDRASDEVKGQLEESFKLAEALGLNGTPSYVVGNDVVVGAVGLNTLKEKVNSARCGKAAC